jgi:hypothetical protein
MLSEETCNKIHTISINLPEGVDPAIVSSFKLGIEKAFQLFTIKDIAKSISDDANRMVALLSSQMEPNRNLIDERFRRHQTMLKIFNEEAWLTAKDINEKQQIPPENKSQPTGDWKRRKKIFSVKTGGKEYFAAYQFDPLYQPRPIIKEIIKEFGPFDDSWKLASWLHFPNGWITKNGVPVAPKEALDQPDVVLDALRQKLESYVA